MSTKKAPKTGTAKTTRTRKATAKKTKSSSTETSDVAEKSTVAKKTTTARGANKVTPKTTAVAKENAETNSEKDKMPVKAETASLAIKETQAPVIKENQTPAVKKTEAPMLKETQAPMVKETQPPVLKEENTAPVIKEDKVSVIHTEKQMGKKFTPIHLGENPYLPHVSTVIEVIKETHNIMTFRVVFDDAEAWKNFRHQAGQVGQLSLFGAGESTFVINSPPSQKEYLQFSVMRTGEVTEALHKLAPGDKVGVRGPLGNCFPREEWIGKDIFFVGGGIGMAPIRTIMLDVLEHKKDYGKVSLLYGARSPNDMAFSYELDEWMNNPDLDCHLTIDNPFDGWQHKVGLIPHILTDINPDPKKTIAVLCGPPIMIKFTVEALVKMNFPDESIITTLEKRMKCGIGICGRCNLGSEYVCVDGPVYSWARLKHLPPEL